MNCEEIQLLLIDFHDKKTSPFLSAEIEEHLKTCKKCRIELKEIQYVLQEMHETDLEKPDKSLRTNFNNMLEEEIKKHNELKTEKPKKFISITWNSPVWKVAAAVLIFVVGIFIGNKTKSGPEVIPVADVRDLKNEVKEMKEVLMFSLLNDESASQRIKAVNYAEEITNPDSSVINALFNTLNKDKNANVRLAAVYSLAKFADKQSVRDSLVESLGRQTEPIIQIVLINVLTEKKEVKAIKPIKEIIQNSKTLKDVKEIAQKSIKIL